MYWLLPFNWGFALWDEFLGLSAPVADELTTRDADAAADLHAAAFREGWTGDDFAALLSQDGVFGFLVRRPGASRAAPLGIVLARLAADEAEILTIVVDRAQRGRGVGRMLMDQVLQRLHRERATSLFLEVEEENRPALALYKRLRFEEVGRRPAYYAGENGQRTAALILKRSLA